MTATSEAIVPTASVGTVIDRGGMAVLTTSALKARVEAVLEAIANVLEEGKDYGKIPGTDKPTLYKPGAEKLCMMFQLASAKPHFQDLSTVDEIRYRDGRRWGERRAITGAARGGAPDAAAEGESGYDRSTDRRNARPARPAGAARSRR